MSIVPHLFDGARSGVGFDDVDAPGGIFAHGLTFAFDHFGMGVATERHAAQACIAREEQGSFAARYHERAAVASKAGRLAEEVLQVMLPQLRRNPLVVKDNDGTCHGKVPELLAGFGPAFAAGATINGGRARQISDGASMRELSLPSELLNRNRGAIALGQPVDICGTRLALTLSPKVRGRGVLLRSARP